MVSFAGISLGSAGELSGGLSPMCSGVLPAGSGVIAGSGAVDSTVALTCFAPPFFCLSAVLQERLPSFRF